jgi:hypothetical protein
MFVRVQRQADMVLFSVVDAQRGSAGGEFTTVLDLGLVSQQQLGSLQAWYGIAERLVASALEEPHKRSVARDLAAWLPPLTRDTLVNARQQDVEQLNVLGAGLLVDELPGPDDSDPLVIIAGWLAED